LTDTAAALPRLGAGAFVLMSVLYLSTVAQARFVGWSKLDPQLKLDVHRAMASGDNALVLNFFVKSTAPELTRRSVVRDGGRVGVVSGDILTVRTSVAGLVTLAGEVPVVFLEASQPVRPQLDHVVVTTGANAAEWQGVGLTGKGVVVGVIDTELDVRHPGFEGRVDFYWEARLDDKGVCIGPNTQNGVCECTSLADQAANKCIIGVPRLEHGTHVTGIAAGASVAIAGSPSTYGGIAPQARIAFVNLGGPGFAGDKEFSLTAGNSSMVCEGAHAIFQYAQSVGKPAVVNMSVGSGSGPRTGKSLASQCMNNLVTDADGTQLPGRVLVGSAGNSGDGKVLSPKHASSPWAAVKGRYHAGGDADDVEQYVPFWPGPRPVEIWTPNDSGVHIEVRVRPLQGEGER